jgi:hypothetical protein
MSQGSKNLVMNVKVEEVEFESEPEAAAASSSSEATGEVKRDPERQWLQCLNNDAIKKENLGRTCEKCGRFTMVKNHKCETRCKICDKKLSSKNYLRNHMQNVHQAQPDYEFFECDLCGLRLKQKGSFIKHLKLNHKGGKIGEFQCDYDGKMFTSKWKLSNHMMVCHCVASKCKMCGSEVKNMKQHKRYLHPVVRITVACKICGKTFKNKISQVYHLKTHNKQYECHVCGHKFAVSTYLKRHLRFHDDPQAFQCQICFKRFNTPSSLRRHVKTHDKNRKSHTNVNTATTHLSLNRS